MLKQFKLFFHTNQLMRSSKPTLLAMSGGVDSVVLSDLFFRSGNSFGIAHCNFGLRGKASDQDQALCKSYAEKYGVPFFVKRFDTKAYAKQHGLSIQMAARELRYAWFEQVMSENFFGNIATAHHQDDLTETILLNQIRGTGITGMHGILPVQGNVIRPMLGFTKKQIHAYATKHDLRYFEDASNTSESYRRNKIRHQVIPVLKQMNPSLSKTFATNAEYMQAAEMGYHAFLDSLKKETMTTTKSAILIRLEVFNKMQFGKIFLSEILKEYGFNLSQVESILKSGSGKNFSSHQFQLSIDRGIASLSEFRQAEKWTEKMISKSDTHTRFMNRTFSFIVHNQVHIESLIKQSKREGKSSIFIDQSKLKYPLLLRAWKKADFFYPFGMKGKKKLSDYFTDEKCSVQTKLNTPILCSGEDVVWIAGCRLDARFVMDQQTKSVLEIRMEE